MLPELFFLFTFSKMLHDATAIAWYFSSFILISERLIWLLIDFDRVPDHHGRSGKVGSGINGINILVVACNGKLELYWGWFDRLNVYKFEVKYASSPADAMWRLFGKWVDWSNNRKETKQPKNILSSLCSLKMITQRLKCDVINVGVIYLFYLHMKSCIMMCLSSSKSFCLASNWSFSAQFFRPPWSDGRTRLIWSGARAPISGMFDKCPLEAGHFLLGFLLKVIFFCCCSKNEMNWGDIRWHPEIQRLFFWVQDLKFDVVLVD